MEDLAGPAPGRPRGRPWGAYALSCVVMEFASRVGRGGVGVLLSGFSGLAFLARWSLLAPQGCCSGSVGWVECVRVDPSTRTCVARNPSSSQATRWVARDERFRPDAGFPALHPSYGCIAETHDSLPIRRVARKRPHPQTTPDAYADWRRPGGGNSAGPAALVSKQRPDCAVIQDFHSSSVLSA